MSNEFTDFNDLHRTQGIDAVQQQIFQSLDLAQNRAQRTAADGVESQYGQYPPEQAAPADDNWMGELLRTKDGGTKPCSGNVEIILRNDPRWKGALGYCDFSYRVVKHHAPMPDMQTGEWDDDDTARTIIWFAHNYRLTITKNHVLEALVVVAQKARFHPVREYLAELTWDGQPRLKSFLQKAMGADTDTDDARRYLEMAGSMFLIGSVARIMVPGCKMDNVLILEGEQGKGKSQVVSILYGDWYSDAPLPLGDKDAYQNIQGVWGSELAELDSFNKAESNTAKMFFSQKRDRFRPPYGHSPKDFKRQCVFIGTTNQDEYLKDYSGNRRYWPVYCRHVDLQWTRDNRDQLWAEALHQFDQNIRWWPDEDEQLVFTKEQDDRLQVDPWLYPIDDFLKTLNRDYVTGDDVLISACRKDTGTQNRADQNRVAPLMKSLGWHKKRKTITTDSGKSEQKHVYVRPDGWEFVKKSEDKQPPMPDDE